jgi:hypothetical protein
MRALAKCGGMVLWVFTHDVGGGCTITPRFEELSPESIPPFIMRWCPSQPIKAVFCL